MPKAKSWKRMKKDRPGEAVTRARVFVPDEETGGLEVSIEGAIPKGLAMLLVSQSLTGEPMPPEMDAHLLDLAKRRFLGTA